MLVGSDDIEFIDVYSVYKSMIIFTQAYRGVF